MKTRSNMPLFVVECSDVKALSNSQIDLLRCGDWLVKKDASGEHAYKVTFKSKTGMCITYHDASVIETQSYDFVDGNWVYNSEDKTENLLDVATKEDIEGGTLENAKPIYYHGLDLYNGLLRNAFQCHILKNDDTAIDSVAKLKQWAENITGKVVIAGNGVITVDSSHYSIYCLIKNTNNSWDLAYVDPSVGYQGISNIDIEDYFSNCDDAYNKIN